MHAAAMVFPNGVLCFARVPASIKPKLGVSIFSQKGCSTSQTLTLFFSFDVCVLCISICLFLFFASKYHVLIIWWNNLHFVLYIFC
uniref:Uncharacterized protein n=1 Tax=Nelumbo nucifera TaxID=4432 RepID=A0A822YZ59_NELNU|nr:TPA_asm: hypothetical protein HUJ06_008441 [Nelumbo nucifera]